jgi:hypothetical protein
MRLWRAPARYVAVIRSGLSNASPANPGNALQMRHAQDADADNGEIGVAIDSILAARSGT